MVNVNMREAQEEVNYLLLSRDEDFAGKLISRENFLLIEANTKYCQVVLVTSSFVWKLTDVSLRLQKSLVYFHKVFVLT